MKKLTFLAAGIAVIGAINLIPAQFGSESAQVTEAKGWNARQPRMDRAQAEREAKEVGDKTRSVMNGFVLTAGQRTRCRQQIQRAMHNPNSFRWEGSMSDMRRTGVIVYSGTNAFGGRVRETYKCA